MSVILTTWRRIEGQWSRYATAQIPASAHINVCRLNGVMWSTKGSNNVRKCSKYTPPLGRKARSEATLSSAWLRVSGAELRRIRRFGVGECATINWPRRTGLLNSSRNQHVCASWKGETHKGGITSVSSGWFCGHQIHVASSSVLGGWSWINWGFFFD